MTLTLPAQVDARRLAVQASHIFGEIPASALSRVSGMYSDVAPASASLRFSMNAARGVVVAGNVKVSFSAECQRCLEPVTIVIDNDFEFEPETEADVQSGVLAQTNDNELWLDVIALLEDEILLASPMIPKHAPGTCRLSEAADATDANVARNPFAPLASLRKVDAEDAPE